MAPHYQFAELNGGESNASIMILNETPHSTTFEIFFFRKQLYVMISLKTAARQHTDMSLASSNA